MTKPIGVAIITSVVGMAGLAAVGDLGLISPKTVAGMSVFIVALMAVAVGLDKLLK